MARPELGIKRQCMNCGAKFYDLARDPAVCPKCGTVFQVAAGRMPAAIARKDEDEDTDEEDETRPDVVSLDEVEQSEEADAAVDEEEGGDDAAPTGGNDDTFLEEEDGDDDVSDLIDNDGENDEEG